MSEIVASLSTNNPFAASSLSRIKYTFADCPIMRE
jgi:hypothetical protein